jgi:hypothetical protein
MAGDLLVTIIKDERGNRVATLWFCKSNVAGKPGMGNWTKIANESRIGRCAPWKPLRLPRGQGAGPIMGAWSKAKGGGKLHWLPFTTFGEIAALGFEAEVHCSSCSRQTKVDPATGV